MVFGSGVLVDDPCGIFYVSEVVSEGAVEPDRAYPEAGLLESLPYGALLGGFPGLELSPGAVPLSLAESSLGLPLEEDPVFVDDDGHRCVGSHLPYT